MRISIFIAVFVVIAFPVLAQIKTSDNVEAVESAYTITDSAIIVRFVKGSDAPYKIYDFSTRAVYVYFGSGKNKGVVSHDFADLVEAEIAYILNLGCGVSRPNNDFKRFCD